MSVFAVSHEYHHLDVQFIQTELDIIGFHYIVHVQKDSSVPNQSLPDPA